MKNLFKLILLSAAALCALAINSCKETPEDPQQYTIKVTDDGHGTATASPTEAEQGTVINLTATPAENYLFSKWTVVSGSAVLEDATASRTTFNMPAENVDIKAEFVIDPSTIEPEYTITVADDGNGTATASHTQAVKDTEITLTATPDSGYIFYKWTVVSGNVVLDDETANPATFTLPEENVSFKAEFIEDYNGFDSIPDPAFKSYCEIFDTDGNGILSRWEIADVVKIEARNMGIESLAGIELFSNLVNLNCSRNSLTALDVSKNTALEALDCSINSITALDVSKNTALISFICSANNLTVLDVSKNVATEFLACGMNELTNLDISTNTAMTYFACHSNKLTALDLSNNANLTDLYIQDNELASLDISSNIALVRMDCSNNRLEALDVTENVSINNIMCPNNNFTVDALKSLFFTLPVRESTNAWVNCKENPGTSALTAADIRVAQEKYWTIFVQ